MEKFLKASAEILVNKIFTHVVEMVIALLNGCSHHQKQEKHL